MGNSAAVREEAIREALRAVVDPEVGVNIVDLGLVYGVDIEPDRVRVRMTMTSPACPMGEMITEEAEEILRRLLPASLRSEVLLVFEPPWDPSMMSDAARRQLGWSGNS